MIGLRKLGVIGLLLVGATTSCGREQTSVGEVTDTNTNWLESCDVDSECGGLTCICGQCSRECERDADCARFGASASCGQPSGTGCDEQTACVRGETTSDVVTSDATCTDCVTTNTSSGTSEQALSTTPFDSNTAESDSARTSAASSTRDTSVTSERVTDTGGSQTTSAETFTIGDDCARAVEGEPCDTEGASCGECTDVCQFCNLMRCDGGAWQRLEAFPAPCVECGEGLDCNALDTYCHVADGATYSCESYPEACSADHSCTCLEAELDGVCSGTAPELTVATGTSVVEQCACTVWLSGSGWCGDVEGPNGEVFDVEWTCNPQTEIYTSLNTECEVMPTGAARWCCPSSFAPTCQ